jgi:hypothetical protein
MKKIEDILSEMNPKSLYEYSPPFAQPKFTEMDYKIVNKLFLTFTSIFPAFKQAWPTESEFEGAKREWMKAFKQVELTDLELIKIGVGRFRLLATPFVPSPGQFIEMCKQSPEDHGLKSPEMAFREACEQSHPSAPKIFSHPTIKLARDLTGSFFISNSPRSKSFPVFEKHYNEAVKLFLKNRNLNQITQETDQQKHERREPDTIDQFKECRSHKSAMDKIKEILK